MDRFRVQSRSLSFVWRPDCPDRCCLSLGNYPLADQRSEGLESSSASIADFVSWAACALPHADGLCNRVRLLCARSIKAAKHKTFAPCCILVVRVSGDVVCVRTASQCESV